MLMPGESVDASGRQFLVSEQDLTYIAAMREYLVDAARSREKVTYGELVEAAELPYPPRRLGRMLILLSEDCDRRGEPGLACLVVAKSTGEVGVGYGGDAARDRKSVYAYWTKR